MTDHDRAREALAKVAENMPGVTPGPWRVGPVDDTRVEDADGNEVAQIDGDYNQPETWHLMEASAAHIAACDPSAMSAIIALVASLDERIAKGYHCPHCDGTGDVHRIDGEYLGVCDCDAGQLIKTKARIGEADASANLFKGKYRAMLKLVNRMRDQLVHVTDHIEDEGDRVYFGSTNDAEALHDIYAELEAWVWDATDKANSMKEDPYAEQRKLRARIAELEGSRDGYAKKALAYERLHDEAQDFIQRSGLSYEARRALKGDDNG